MGKFVPKNAYSWTSAGFLRLVEMYNTGAMHNPDRYEDLIVFPENASRPSVIPNPFRDKAEDAVINALKHGHKMALDGKTVEDVIAVYKNKGSLTGEPAASGAGPVKTTDAPKSQQKGGSSKKGSKKTGDPKGKNEGKEEEDNKNTDSGNANQEVEPSTQEVPKLTYALKSGELIECTDDDPAAVTLTHLRDIVSVKEKHLSESRVPYKPSELWLYLSKENEYFVMLTTDHDAIRSIDVVSACPIDKVSKLFAAYP
jgi:hypothetical protein